MPLAPTPQEKGKCGPKCVLLWRGRSVRDEEAKRRENNSNNKPNHTLPEAVIHIS